MPVYTKKNLLYCVYCDGPKRIWEPFGKDTPQNRAAAEARDFEIKARKKRGAWHPSTYSLITFRDLAQAYIDERAPELAKNTVDCIFYTLTAYVPDDLQKTSISRITLADWTRIQQQMIKAGAQGKKLKLGTINKYFHYLDKIWRWAIEGNDPSLIDRNPWERRKRLSDRRERQKTRLRLLSLADLKRIIAFSAPHLAWSLAVAYYTGARTGPTELFALQWKHVDWGRGGIRIPGTKTVRSRRWQFPDKQFMPWLRMRYDYDQEKYPDCPWICHYRGEPISSLKTAWRTAKKKAGITKRIRITDIRHFHITYALAGGADIMDLAERVGHSNARMIIDVYAHLAKDIQTNQPHNIPKL